MTTAQGQYGPQTPQVEALVERAQTLTAEEADRLAAAWNAVVAVSFAAWAADWAADWAAAWNAVEAADRTPDRLRDAVRAAAVEIADRPAAWDAALAAALAVAVRDLIDRARYDTLTWPWRAVIGPIHPDDGNPDTLPKSSTQHCRPQPPLHETAKIMRCRQTHDKTKLQADAAALIDNYRTTWDALVDQTSTDASPWADNQLHDLTMLLIQQAPRHTTQTGIHTQLQRSAELDMLQTHD